MRMMMTRGCYSSNSESFRRMEIKDERDNDKDDNADNDCALFSREFRIEVLTAIDIYRIYRIKPNIIDMLLMYHDRCFHYDEKHFYAHADASRRILRMKM